MRACVRVCVCACVYVCGYVRERERDTDRQTDRETERQRETERDRDREKRSKALTLTRVWILSLCRCQAMETVPKSPCLSLPLEEDVSTQSTDPLSRWTHDSPPALRGQPCVAGVPLA